MSLFLERLAKTSFHLVVGTPWITPGRSVRRPPSTRSPGSQSQFYVNFLCEDFFLTSSPIGGIPLVVANPYSYYKGTATTFMIVLESNDIQTETTIYV